MKKLIFTSMLLLCAITSYSQSVPGQHMDFHGIPLDGHIHYFVEKFESFGFKSVEQDFPECILEGELHGEDCLLIIFSTPKSNTVYKVEVIFPISNVDLLNNFYLKHQLIIENKHGSYTKENEDETITSWYFDTGEIRVIKDYFKEENEASIIVIFEDFTNLFLYHIEN